jgi:HD superfamily phosphohydrolase
MDFLAIQSRPKVLRTNLYEDQEFSHFELEILHTPLYQRLYELKQLGYSDRVFPDAVHSRFNHLLGVAEVAGRMMDRIIGWLLAHATQNFEFSKKVGDGWQPDIISAPDLCTIVRSRRPVVRLMALLHDLTHAPFGHTLEDEVCIFKERHDAPERQILFFDTLTAQLITIWAIENRVPGVGYGDLDSLSAFEFEDAKIIRLGSVVLETISSEKRKIFTSLLRELELAFKLLLCLEGAHLDQSGKKTNAQGLKELTAGDTENLLISRALRDGPLHSPGIELEIHRDLFCIDVVGNTICADLIDYAKRDSSNAGLKVSFDERLLRYLCIVSVDNAMVPGGNRALRVAMQVFTDKLRHDVLSEMSSLLKARYLISERITFHPTKCAAGACLGTAIQLIGLVELPRWVQALGDQNFLSIMMRLANGIQAYACEKSSLLPKRARKGKNSRPLELNLPQEELPETAREIIGRLWPTESQFGNLINSCVIELDRQLLSVDEIKARAEASRSILLKLSARRYPKLAYRLDPSNRAGGENNHVKLAKRYNRPDERFKLERYIEKMCDLPLGTVHVHCPVATTSMKVAHALVVGNDLTNVSHLRTVTKIYGDSEQLSPYEQEIQAIEDMYRSIWRMNIYVDTAFRDRRAVVALASAKELHFQNDGLLANASEEGPLAERNEYDILAEREGKFAFDDLPYVVRALDGLCAQTRHRLVSETEMESMVTQAIQIAKRDHAPH